MSPAEIEVLNKIIGSVENLQRMTRDDFARERLDGAKTQLMRLLRQVEK